MFWFFVSSFVVRWRFVGVENLFDWCEDRVGVIGLNVVFGGVFCVGVVGLFLWLDILGFWEVVIVGVWVLINLIGGSRIGFNKCFRRDLTLLFVFWYLTVNIINVVYLIKFLLRWFLLSIK